jgi:hypothetical protein
MNKHPYRDPAAKPATRRVKAEAWAIAIVLVWIVATARALAALFDHSLAGPDTGLAIAIAVGIPIIAVNARVLSDVSGD